MPPSQKLKKKVDEHNEKWFKKEMKKTFGFKKFYDWLSGGNLDKYMKQTRNQGKVGFMHPAQRDNLILNEFKYIRHKLSINLFQL